MFRHKVSRRVLDPNLDCLIGHALKIRGEGENVGSYTVTLSQASAIQKIELRIILCNGMYTDSKVRHLAF